MQLSKASHRVLSIGNLYVEKDWHNIGTVQLTARVEKAWQFKEREARDLAEWMLEHGVVPKVTVVTVTVDAHEEAGNGEGESGKAAKGAS